MNRLDRFLLNVANGIVPDGTSWSDEARAIIDERLIQTARELAADHADAMGTSSLRRAYLQGDHDNTRIVQTILKALRRGASFGEI